MSDHLPLPDSRGLDGCSRACRNSGNHSRVYGACTFGIKPEPTLSISRTALTEDGHRSIVFDVYETPQLADTIEPGLRKVGQQWGIPEDAYPSLAHAAASALMANHSLHDEE